jgi:regulatory protein
MIPKDKLESCKDAALRLLSYCPRSIKEISDRLNKKGFSADTIENVISALKKAGYLDDLKFAKDRIDSKLRKNPVSKNIIRAQLALRGIDEPVIDEALSGFEEAFDEYKIARDILEKHLKSLKDLEPDKALKRLYPYLRKQGFSEEVIEKILREKFNVE